MRRYRYLFVDEFQDTDAAQIDLVLELRERLDCRLFVVGDVKQGIYRFRGAEGNAFEELLRPGQTACSLRDDRLRPDPQLPVRRAAARLAAPVLRALGPATTSSSTGTPTSCGPRHRDDDTARRS